MKRALLILVGGLALSLVAGFGVYYSRTATHRAMLCCPKPELAWLQHEFKLDDAAFARAATLHSAYLTNCSELCERISATNELVRQQFARDGAVTPAVNKLLGDAAQLRVECQTRMLRHFLAVSQTMPPEQGKRYFAWVQEHIFSMGHEQLAPGKSETQHGH